MKTIIENLASIPSLVWLLIALVTIIAYRFIPPTKRMRFFFGLTVKPVGEPDVYVSGRMFMMVVVSICVLAASLYIILSRKYDDSSQKFAYGAIGTIVGHWLKS